MSNQENHHRLNFNKHLHPIKTMLSWKKNHSSHQDWLAFVERTKQSIINQPEQYLGNELPDRETMRTLLTDIFDEFVQVEIFN